MTEPPADVKRQVAELIAMIAHDLRGQVTTIKGFSQLALRQADPSSPSRAYLSVAVEEANRMASLIDDLVLFSQLDVHPTVRIEPTEILEVLRIAIERTRRLGVPSGLTVRAEATDLIAWCDPFLTVRALAQLLCTARRYQAKDLPIVVTVRQVEGDVVVEVLSASEMDGDKLRALQRVAGAMETNPNDDFSPSGLGLHICYRLIALQRGRVWIDQPPNRGTRFSIALPGNATDHETSPRGDLYQWS